MATTTKRKKAAAADDIGQETRLELYRLQVELRYCEKRAYDLFLQNLIKGTSHLSLGQAASALRCGRMTGPSAPTAAMRTRWHAGHP
jgi:TPP-dependent pyruvate/acetoin dehydrogenase alpha subunit